MKNILGISCYFHDSACALVNGADIVAAAQEERFSRLKQDASFPVKAIDFCLKKGGVSAGQLDAVAFYEKPITKMLRLAWAYGRYGQDHAKEFEQNFSSWVNERLHVEERFRQDYGFKGEFYYLEHHLSHAASAFYPSLFDQAAILTVDGVGEYATTTCGIGHGNDLQILEEISYPHSLGMLYSTITAFLGFRINNDEYKVMGLASYGNPVYLEAFRKLATVLPDGAIQLNLRYFSFHTGAQTMFSPELLELLGPPRVPDSDLFTPRHADIAASLQVFLEEALSAMLDHLHSLTGLDSLCLAGGVALNSVANWTCFKRSKFKEIFIPPAANDAGCALGAALYINHKVVGTPRTKTVHSALLGPDFNSREICQYLDAQQADYEILPEEKLYDTVADLIHQDKIVGWFQGRMEFGPRALGCRSILANPCNARMKDTLNRRVKFREDFRPFAPAVLAENAQDYFDIDFDSPYMLFVPPVKPEKSAAIPAVTHIDGSARVQTVTQSENPRFYNLIKAFEKRSGVPVLINTSFNINGEPIVCSPADAYHCFLYTDIDYLVMENVLVRKIL